MSLTLGEKLRQAREERGFTLSEVSEQTRISSLYLESIENDDYRTLPGGIFNKGFVKSYAKFVGLNEQEALADYSSILADSQISESSELKLYKPEVLTDDRSSSSMIPTLILAVVILAVMTGGILFLVNYLRRPAEVTTTNPSSTGNSNTLGPVSNSNIEVSTASVPGMENLKVEFRALNQLVSLTATLDGKLSNNNVAPGTIATFEPKQSLKLSYSRSLAQVVQLAINGKSITLPAVPLNPKRAAIEFEINKENLGQIWTTGAISTEVPAATPDANIAVASTPVTAPTQTATPKGTPVPAATATNTANANTAMRARPTPTIKTNPLPKPTVIIVPSANRPQ